MTTPVDIQFVEQGVYSRAQIARRNKLAKGICCGRESARDLDPEVAQSTDHLAKRRVFATHLVDIGQTQLFKFLRVVLQQTNLSVIACRKF